MYRKKPIVIEAMNYDGTRESFERIWDWMDGDSVNSPHMGYQGPSDDDPQAFGIRTLEGKITASPGDWIIKGIKGEFYPCKPDVFEATYEPKEDASE